MKGKERKKMHISFGGFICGLTVVGLAVGLIFNYLSLNEVSAKLNAAESKYNALVSQQKALSYEIEKQVNFTNIDQLASGIGMVKLQPGQIQYVDLVEADTMAVYKSESDNNLARNIVASFNILVEYLK